MSTIEETQEKPVVAVGVNFRRGGKLYYFAPNGVRVSTGDHVLARTERGVDIGEVIVVKDTLEPGEQSRALKPLVRRATRDDLRREDRLREREKEASAICQAKVAEHGLPMKLIDADYTFDGQRLLFFFASEGRVDFRALVRDLAETFHCRIELRQVGVRDEAKMVGGLGPCGRPLCCAQWLRTFDPVGIKVAKDQGMSLNPAKISGICDRLMCCLLYEQPVYEELAARLPRFGDQVRGPGRTGVVRVVTLLKESVTVEFTSEEGTESVEVSAENLRRARGYWLLLSGGDAVPFSPPGEPEPKAVVREPRRQRDPQAAPPARQRETQSRPPEARPEGERPAEQRRRPSRGGAPRPSAPPQGERPPTSGERGPTSSERPQKTGERPARSVERAPRSGERPPRTGEHASRPGERAPKPGDGGPNSGERAPKPGERAPGQPSEGRPRSRDQRGARAPQPPPKPDAPPAAAGAGAPSEAKPKPRRWRNRRPGRGPGTGEGGGSGATDGPPKDNA